MGGNGNPALKWEFDGICSADLCWLSWLEQETVNCWIVDGDEPKESKRHHPGVPPGRLDGFVVCLAIEIQWANP